jgi:hypothetical protein
MNCEVCGQERPQFARKRSWVASAEKCPSSPELPVHGLFVRIIPARFLHLWLCILICSLSLGCVAAPPVPAPTRINGMSGTGSTDLSFIRVGITGRGEVTEKLGWTDTGVNEEGLFLGRWSSSSRGTAYVVGMGSVGSSGVNRSWKTHDVLIEFNENGVVKQYGEFSDAELVKQLSAWIAKGHVHTLDLSKPIEIWVTVHHGYGKNYEGKLVLGKESLRLTEPGNTTQDFTISPGKIRMLGSSRQAADTAADPRGISQTIEFVEKTKVGNKLTLLMDVPAIVILVKYLAQIRTG